MSTTTRLATIKAKYKGVAPCYWCPKCAHKLEECQIIGKNNMTISGKKCANCGYILNQTISQ